MKRFLPTLALIFAASCQSTGSGIDTWGSLTIYQASWTDSGEVYQQTANLFGEEGPCLVANVVEWDGWPKMKEFTTRASQEWTLIGTNGTRIPARSGTGGTSTGNGDVRAIVIWPGKPLPDIGSGVSYELVPENQLEGASWTVLPAVRIAR